MLPWAVAATATALALGSALFRVDPAPTEATRATILAPAGTQFDLSILPGIVSVSPDGRSLAFGALNAEGEKVLFVRDLQDIEASPLPGTEGAQYPFWSPDGRFVAFFADGKLKKVETAGGPPVTLAPARLGKGGAWSPAGVIVFAPTNASALSRVSAAGGEATEITEVDRDRFNSHRHPQFLPDGEHFLFFARTAMGGEAEPSHGRESRW